MDHSHTHTHTHTHTHHHHVSVMHAAFTMGSCFECVRKINELNEEPDPN